MNHDVVVVVVVNHDVVVVHVWQYSDAVGRARGEVRMNVASGESEREQTTDALTAKCHRSLTVRLSGGLV